MRSRAQAEIERVVEIRTDCLRRYGGPPLCGERSMADAMYAPVLMRFETYDVRKSERASSEYCLRVMDMPEMQEWIAAALREPEQIDQLEVEF